MHTAAIQAVSVNLIVLDKSIARGVSSIDDGIAMMLPWFRDNPNYYDASVYNV